MRSSGSTAITSSARSISCRVSAACTGAEVDDGVHVLRHHPVDRGRRRTGPEALVQRGRGAETAGPFRLLFRGQLRERDVGIRVGIRHDPTLTEGRIADE